MAWLERWLFYLVEMELKSVLVKCEVYLCSAFEPYVKDCLANKLINRCFCLMFSQGGQEKGRVCQLWCFQKLFVVASFSAQEALEVLRGQNMAKQNTKHEGHAKATKPTNVEKNPTFFLNRLSKKGTLVLLKKLFLWGLGAVPALRKLRGLLKAMGTAMGTATGRETWGFFRICRKGKCILPTQASEAVDFKLRFSRRHGHRHAPRSESEDLRRW